MKKYVKPSWWLAILLCIWSILTISFAFVKTYAAVVVVRVIIGVLEAGFYPGELVRDV